jgi:predicted kinase
MIREQMTGGAHIQHSNGAVWEEVYRQVHHALTEGRTVVVDATFAKAHERRAFIQFAKDSGATKVQGVFAAVPYDVASERNQSRERVVPPHATMRMQTQLEQNPPVVEDGFDAVFDINELQELTRVEMQHENRVSGKEFRRLR